MPPLPGIQNVIVAMDGHRLADAAIIAAVHVSRVLAAQLHIVHALNPGDVRSWFEDEATTAKRLADLQAHARQARLEHLQTILAPLEDSDLDPEALLSVRLGKPANVLLERTESLTQPFLLLGSHQERDLFDFGGTTREILSAATCPVWIQPGPWTPIRQVLTAVDLSEGSDATLAVAKRLANLLSARLTVMHVFEPPQIDFRGFDPADAIEDDRQRAKADFDAFLEATLGTKMSFDKQFLEGRPSELILARESEVDLIVMGSHGHSKFAQVMLGSQAHRVAKRAGCPVVLVPQRAVASLSTGSPASPTPDPSTPS